MAVEYRYNAKQLRTLLAALRDANVAEYADSTVRVRFAGTLSDWDHAPSTDNTEIDTGNMSFYDAAFPPGAAPSIKR